MSKAIRITYQLQGKQNGKWRDMLTPYKKYQHAKDDCEFYMNVKKDLGDRMLWTKFRIVCDQRFVI